jgi:tRNA1(Val) A37 N6-methylase TrmN6
MFLYQPIDGYCYNSDTHILYDFIENSLKQSLNPHGELLDIGSGSGILGLLIAKEFAKIHLAQCEIQEEMIFLSNHNAKINAIQNKMYEGDFLRVDFDKNFDIVVSNPPFYHKDVNKSKNDNINYARYNDHLPLEQLIQKVSAILSNKGKFFFCYDAKQLQEIMLLLNRCNFGIESLRFAYSKKCKDANIVLIYARKNSKSLMRIKPPLIMFEGEEFSPDIKAIYQKVHTHSIKCLVGEQEI